MAGAFGGAGASTGGGFAISEAGYGWGRLGLP